MPDRHCLGKNQIFLFREIDHLLKLPAVQRDGFLDEEVFAVLKCLFHEGVMRVVRACEVDDVHVLILKHVIDLVVDLFNLIFFCKVNCLLMRPVCDRV